MEQICVKDMYKICLKDMCMKMCIYKDAPFPLSAAKPLLTNPTVSQTPSAPEVQTS